MNPYAVAPWVVAVGATDERGWLASYSSRGGFGDDMQHPTLVAPGTNIVGPRSLVGTTGATGAAAPAPGAMPDDRKASDGPARIVSV